jgi:hypothetical protein
VKVASGWTVSAMVLRVMVARSPSSDRKLWMDNPSWVRFVAPLAFAASERCALPTIDGRASALTPGGNLTGFARQVSGVAYGHGAQRQASQPIFNPDTTTGGGSFFLPSFEATARSRSVEPITAPVRSDAEIEMVMTALVIGRTRSEVGWASRVHLDIPCHPNRIA